MKIQLQKTSVLSAVKKKSFVLFCVLSWLCLPATTLLAGNGPAWWTTRNVFSGKPADDYAAANIGQLKFIAAKAAEELNAKTSGGAGNAINNLVASWNAAPAAGVVRNDFAPLTVGQLKAVSKLFYDRIAAAGMIPANKYPWKKGEGADPMNNNIANLGQLKTVFSFVAVLPAAGVDSDGDGLEDLWEIQNFLNLSRNGNEVLTAGGLRVRDAAKNNLDPQALKDGTGGVGDNKDINGLPATGADIFVYDSRGWLKEATLTGAPKRTFVQDAEGNITNVQ